MLANQLIHQQIINNLKAKEDELIQNNEESLKLLQDKLEKKEYALQVCEFKIYSYEKYLQRKALVDKESRNLLFKFQQEDEEANSQNIKISNVIDENLQLKEELKSAFAEINQFQEQVQILSLRIVDLEDEVKLCSNSN